MASSEASQGGKLQVSQLDYTNPLFLQLSDTPGALLIGLKLTGLENYTLWSRIPYQFFYVWLLIIELKRRRVDCIEFSS